MGKAINSKEFKENKFMRAYEQRQAMSAAKKRDVSDKKLAQIVEKAEKKKK